MLGATYVAGYVAPAGRYADDQDSLSAASPRVSGPLTATAGVYTYGSGMPTSTWNESNYYVDVLFVADDCDPGDDAASGDHDHHASGNHHHHHHAASDDHDHDSS